MIVVLVHQQEAIGQLTWDGIATIAAAVVAALVAVWGYAHQQRAARRERRATMYSEALQAVEDYLEAPYIVLRRDGSAAARMTISTCISDVQSRLSYFSAMVDVHAPVPVAEAFQTFVAGARADAGSELSKAWRAKPLRRDREVPLGARYNRACSDEARAAFLAAIKKYDRSSK